MQKNQKNQIFVREFNQVCLIYSLDPTLGYLNDPDPKFEKKYSKNLAPWKQILLKLPKFTASSDLEAQIKKIEHLDLPNQEIYQLFTYLKDYLSLISGKYVALSRNQGKKDVEIIIPYPLSYAVIYVSKVLGTKVGHNPTMASNFQFISCSIEQDSYKFGQNPQKLVDYSKQMKLENMKLKYTFTENQWQERVFFGTSIISSYIMFSMIRKCYEINQYIQSEKKSEQIKQFILQGFKQIQQNWGSIQKLLKCLLKQLKPQFFYNQIRPHVQGFENISFQKIQGKHSSGGGSTGQDPSYQLFQKVFGIQVIKFSQVQTKLREGMYGRHIELQEWFWRHSKIRSYCMIHEDLTTGYENIIKLYVQFYQAHNIFVKKYIMEQIPKDQLKKAKGTGGNYLDQITKRGVTVQVENLQNKWH